jgi:hypothetical protein
VVEQAEGDDDDTHVAWDDARNDFSVRGSSRPAAKNWSTASPSAAGSIDAATAAPPICADALAQMSAAALQPQKKDREIVR